MRKKHRCIKYSIQSIIQDGEVTAKLWRDGNIRMTINARVAWPHQKKTVQHMFKCKEPEMRVKRVRYTTNAVRYDNAAF